MPATSAPPSAAARAGSSAHVSYVRPQRLSRERSWTGANTQFQPVAAVALPVTWPPVRAAAVSQVAPMPIDCGNSGASVGWPNPCTASTPKITGMCSREWATAYPWIALYSFAQSSPVLPGPPLPVVSGGTSVPPASSEPVWLVTRICCMQVGLGRLKPPWLVHASVWSVIWVTSCWSIWPTFSASVMALSRADTRASTGRLASSHGWVAGLGAAVAPWPAATPVRVAARTPPTTRSTPHLPGDMRPSWNPPAPSTSGSSRRRPQPAAAPHVGAVLPPLTGFHTAFRVGISA